MEYVAHLGQISMLFASLSFVANATFEKRCVVTDSLVSGSPSLSIPLSLYEPFR